MLPRRLATLALGLGLLGAAAPANADAFDNGFNWLAGPLFALELGSASGKAEVGVGIEGGIGRGPERLNGGYEWRSGPEGGLAYIQLDPWVFVGGTLGLGVDGRGDLHGILGLWEGLPLSIPGCKSDSSSVPVDVGLAVTIAGGYRYTGVHELYISIKAGQSQGVCINW